jgi:hypothetical protein
MQQITDSNIIKVRVNQGPGKFQNILNSWKARGLTDVVDFFGEKPKGTDVKLLVKKSGTGMDTRYTVEHAN